MASNPGDHGLGGPGALAFTSEPNSDVSEGRFLPNAPREQLYDLAGDRSQTVNVVREHPEIARRMKERLQVIRAGKQTRP